MIFMLYVLPFYGMPLVCELEVGTCNDFGQGCFVPYEETYSCWDDVR